MAAANPYRHAARRDPADTALAGPLQKLAAARSNAAKRSPRMAAQARHRATASRNRKSAALRAFLGARR